LPISFKKDFGEVKKFFQNKLIKVKKVGENVTEFQVNIIYQILTLPSLTRVLYRDNTAYDSTNTSMANVQFHKRGYGLQSVGYKHVHNY